MPFVAFRVTSLLLLLYERKKLFSDENVMMLTWCAGRRRNPRSSLGRSTRWRLLAERPWKYAKHVQASGEFTGRSHPKTVRRFTDDSRQPVVSPFDGERRAAMCSCRARCAAADVRARDRLSATRDSCKPVEHFPCYGLHLYIYILYDVCVCVHNNRRCVYKYNTYVHELYLCAHYIVCTSGVGSAP